MARRISDEQLLSAIGFVGVAAFFLSKAAVRGDESSTAAGAPLQPQAHPLDLTGLGPTVRVLAVPLGLMLLSEVFER